MTNHEEHLQLAGDFPPVTHHQWRALVDGVLAKGLSDPTPEALARRFERTLVSHTYDGITIQPLYDDPSPAERPTDSPAEQPTESPDGGRDRGLPGQAPFVRGRTALANATTGWEICQRVEVTGDLLATNAQVLNELENGATSLWLGLAGTDDTDTHDADTHDAGSHRLVSADVLDRLLAGVYLDLVPIRLDGGRRGAAAAASLVELWARRNVAPADARGSFGIDPIGEAARSGRTEALDAGLGELVGLAATCARDMPGVRASVVDAIAYHRAGASDAEELGCALAATVAYLRAMEAGGLSLASAWGQMEIRLSATAEQFLSIAKFRAARLLWGRIGQVLGIDPALATPPLHAVTSPAMLSAYDPWVNLLRTTVACFAAGVGGADAVTVAPYDAVAVGPTSSELGRRLARNIQSLLIEESGIARIIDPAGGSWYVEALTDDLATAAWTWFQQIEAGGGMVAALSSDLVGRRLAATWQARLARLATGADPLTGVSEYPNIDEAPPVVAPDAGPAAHSRSGLAIHRYPEAFERLRARSDRHLAHHGERPTVFLATLGTPTNFTARATFAKNFFEVVGIRALSDETPGADVVGSFKSSGATLVCLCSNDKIYQQQAVDVARALSAAGAEHIYLAGRPGDQQSEWEVAGINEFVYQGSDRLDALARALDLAGVA